MVHPVKVPFSAQDYLKSTGRHTLADDWIASGLPRWVTLIDEALFVVAAAIFVRGSFDFYPSATYSVYLEGCELFILGSLMQLGLAFFTTYEICEDARRSGREPERSLLFEQALYVAGSVFFTVGTILFTPPIGFLSSLGGIRTPSQPVSPEPTAAADAAAAAASMAGGGAVADIVSGGGGVVDTVAELADTVVSAAENLKIGFFGTSVELQVTRGTCTGLLGAGHMHTPGWCPTARFSPSSRSPRPSRPPPPPTAFPLPLSCALPLRAASQSGRPTARLSLSSSSPLYFSHPTLPPPPPLPSLS